MASNSESAIKTLKSDNGGPWAKEKGGDSPHLNLNVSKGINTGCTDNQNFPCRLRGSAYTNRGKCSVGNYISARASL